MDDSILYLIDLLNNDPDARDFGFDTINDGTELEIDGEYVRAYVGISFDDDYIEFGGIEVTSARGDRFEFYSLDDMHNATNELERITSLLDAWDGSLLLM